MKVTQESEAASVLMRADAFAAHLVAQAKALCFEVAHSQEELEAVFRLRYLTVIEKGWAKPEDYPAGYERDADDDRAIQVVARDGDMLVATMRIVLPAAGSLLPTEAAFGMNLKTCGRMVDVGRLCVSPAYRSRERRVWSTLIGQTWLEMRVRGFSEACSIMTPSVARVYRSLGLQIIILGGPRNYWGKERFAVCVKPAHKLFELSKRSHEPDRLIRMEQNR